MRALYWIEATTEDRYYYGVTLERRVDNFRESVQPSLEHGLVIYRADDRADNKTVLRILANYKRDLSRLHRFEDSARSLVASVDVLTANLRDADEHLHPETGETLEDVADVEDHARILAQLLESEG